MPEPNESTQTTNCLKLIDEYWFSVEYLYNYERKNNKLH